MKFLVLWRLDAGRPGPDLIRAIAQQPNYAKKLQAEGKLECRYHLIGQHGGAWIYKVKSNEDMMRVPGTKGSPLEYKARGRDVRIVYSPMDALKLAQANPGRHVTFFAIGFETTAPSTARTLMQARTLGIRNFSVFCNHVTIIPAIRAILDSPDAAGRLHRPGARVDRDRLPPV